MITYALDILREGISDGLGRPLTTAEKLACRVLLPVVGKEQVTRFAAHLQGGNPMYRRGLLEGALEAMERAVAG